MKKTIGLLACAAIIFAGMRVVIALNGGSGEIPKDNITVVKAIEQESAEEHPEFKIEVVDIATIEGTNVAMKDNGGKITENGHNDVYVCDRAIDGDRTGPSYWEGDPQQERSEVTVELDDSYNIHTILVALNPDMIWGKRTQNIGFSISDDGENFTELVANTDFDFDPKTGNFIIAEGLEAKAKFVKASFGKNTGASAGQMAEIQIYTKDK